MDDYLVKMLAGLGKPPHKTRFVGAKFTLEEFHKLQSYCAARYLSFSDAIRAAVVTLTNDTE